MGNLESNLYVVEFMPGAGDSFDQISQLEAEIQQERQGWLNSGAA